jgi:predicted small lipoprotein YifL
MMRRRSSFMPPFGPVLVLLLIFIVGLGGCGKRGDLRLPTEQSQSQYQSQYQWQDAPLAERHNG